MTFYDFDRYFESALRDTSGRLLDGIPKKLRESIDYSLLSPGKRIRPRLAIAASHWLEVPRPAALAVAVAIEMIHCFTLIHDDLPCMDDDDERRGRPSNHIKFGEAHALLAGDGLIPIALAALWDAAPALGPERSTRFAKGFTRFLQAAGPQGVVGGQALEIEQNPPPTLEALLKIHQLKTGALFEAALLTPLDFSDVAPTDPRGEILAEFAQALGLAFQIADDLEDLPEPSGILAFMTPREATEYALETLNAKHSALTTVGKSNVTPLLEISDEVQKKIRGAIHGA